MTIDETSQTSGKSTTSVRSPAAIALVVIAIALVCLSAGAAAAAFEVVTKGEVSGSALLVSIVALLTFSAGALMRLLRGSRATALFGIAAIGFSTAAIEWGFPLRPALICSVGALAAIAAVAITYVVRK